jgi:hypothetical protein
LPIGNDISGSDSIQPADGCRYSKPLRQHQVCDHRINQRTKSRQFNDAALLVIADLDRSETVPRSVIRQPAASAPAIGAAKVCATSSRNMIGIPSTICGRGLAAA